MVVIVSAMIDTKTLPFVSVPHAGILTMPAFLQRYPSTETNRNRARARWTYKFFLDVDIEKSAARTTDPVALADTNNPTMNNKNCTVCHQRMDPVAVLSKCLITMDIIFQTVTIHTLEL